MGSDIPLLYRMIFLILPITTK